MKNLKLYLLFHGLFLCFGTAVSELTINHRVSKSALVLSRYFADQQTSHKIVTRRDVSQTYRAMHGQSMSNISDRDMQFYLGAFQAAVDLKFKNLEKTVVQDVIAMEDDFKYFLSAKNLIFVEKDLIGMLFTQGTTKADLNDIQKVLDDVGSMQAKEVSKNIQRMNSGVRAQFVKNINNILSYLKRKADAAQGLAAQGLVEKPKKQTQQEILNAFDATLEDVHSLFDDTHKQHQSKELVRIVDVLAEISKAIALEENAR